MRNNWFDFKQFRIVQDRSAFRVGTDGVLLGAWASFAGRERILDAGTGTGVIAIMAAQRSNAAIIAIEPDMLSAEEACVNVKASRWSDRISVENITLQVFAESSEKQNNPDNQEYQENQGKSGSQREPGKSGFQGIQFDMLVTNPPFFTDSLHNSDRRLSNARHNITLSQLDLIESAEKLLSPAGVLSLILPWEEGRAFITTAACYGFYCNRITRVRSLPSLPAHRLLMEFSKERTPFQSDWLIISNGERKDYTVEYRELTKEFYLEF